MLNYTEMTQKQLIGKIKRALEKQPVRLAYLYGSYATGKVRRGRDIDIAVVLEPGSDKADCEIAADVYKKAIATGGPDIDVRKIDLKTSPVFLANTLKPARPLLVKDEKERIRFEKKAFQKYYDSQHLRNISYYYLAKRTKEGKYGRGGANYQKAA